MKLTAMTPPSKPRLRVRRQPSLARYDRESVDRVLDRGIVAHVAFVDDGLPYCIPTLHARIGDDVLIHGSNASRMTRLLAAGAPACLTVTMLDGLVLARSVFEHSVNYDSVALFGCFEPIDEHERKLAALQAFTERLVPGRWAEVRQPDRKELKATRVLSMSIADASVKCSDGPPDDDDTPDAQLDVWAGVIPLHSRYGTPQPSPGLRPGIPLAPSVDRLLAGRAPAQVAARP